MRSTKRIARKIEPELKGSPKVFTKSNSVLANNTNICGITTENNPPVIAIETRVVITTPFQLIF